MNKEVQEILDIFGYYEGVHSDHKKLREEIGKVLSRMHREGFLLAGNISKESTTFND